MTLISIDPNVNRMALAKWINGKLAATYYLRSDLKGTKNTFLQLHELNIAPDEIAIEVPEIYKKDGMKKKKSLMKLDFYAGFACGALYVPGTIITRYLPKEWKGQVPKDIMAPRILGKLSPTELQNLTLPGFKTMDHDIIDAVGIGLKHLGRI